MSENSANGEEQNEVLSVEQEYELWKKNCHFMYDFVYESHINWPSLSIQWLPDLQLSNDAVNANLILGTNTSGADTENVKLMSTNLPYYLMNNEETGDATDKSNIKTATKIKIKKKFKHFNTEVNRTRYMPQNQNIIASISGEGTAYVFYNDVNKKGNRSPILSLKHHKDNGFGLDWSPFVEGQLLTAADDKEICLWDINYKAVQTKFDESEIKMDSIKPLHVVSSHKDIVNDVKWHKFDQNLFGSVSDDKSLMIFDTRDLSKPAMVKENIHLDSVNSLAFSTFSRNLLATGSSDSSIGLFDLRNLNLRLHSMMGHSESITSLEWSPHTDGFLASGSEDRRVIIWDISKIGEEQSQDDADDGAPELFMMHAGHTSMVTDLSWHPNEKMKWLLSSVSDNNVIQLWKPTKNLTDPVDGWDNNDVELKDLE